MLKSIVCVPVFALSLLIAQGAPPQNIILFIGDGMGPEQVKAANYYHGGSLSFEGLPHQAFCTTDSANSSVTDSAAAATAIATGVKVNNDVISLAIPGDRSELETMLELFKKRGKQTGLITTAYLTHATPAAFGAHETSRGNYTAIGNDLLTQSQPNVLFGGGANGLDPITAAGYGYDVATDTAGFNALDTTSDQLCALFGSGYMPYEEDYLGSTYPYPHLTQMVNQALDALAGPEGFFLLVEAGRIDHACHSNLLREAIHETLELSRAVAAARAWIETHTDTLLIVTADHETGGLQVTETSPVAGAYPSVKWSSTGHTGVNVPVYARGPYAELVSGTLDNTDFLSLVTLEDPTTTPKLSRVSVQDLTDVTATIVWDTDVNSDSIVEYREYGSTYWTVVSDATPTTTHRVLITDLNATLLYEYRVTSYAGTDSATSTVYTFQPFYDPDAPLTLIAEGSLWKYHDNGELPPGLWNQPGYVEDTTWDEGLAQLGYGDGDETTVISYGPSSSDKYRTYYFRHTFTVADRNAYGSLSLHLLYDDGAVVYLNGTEVYRINMPAGEITYSTYASSASDYGWVGPVTLPTALLVSGNNVLAVEVHQANATSSDVSFDLRLEATDPNNVQIVKGPYLQKVTDTSIVVMWETDGAAGSRVDYGLGGSDENSIIDETPVTLHEVTLNNLTPNTTYYYTVASGYAVSDEASFTTAPLPGAADTFRFAVYSDTQQYPDNHLSVATAIAQNNPPPRFLLHVGDLVDQGLTYDAWGTEFFIPGAGLLPNTPLFPTIGNHEYSATFPMPYFDWFRLPANGAEVGSEEWYAFTYGTVRFIVLNSSAPYATDSEQYNWLLTELASSAYNDAVWRIVLLHHPAYSDSPTVDIQTYLVPLFHQYGVHIVFSGHNHNYRHVLRTDPTYGSEVDYVITGGGGATPVTPGTLPNDDTLTQLAAEAVLHHCVVDVTATSLSLQARRNDGTAIESFLLVLDQDETAPGISGLQVTAITDSSATVTWETDEHAMGDVAYRIEGSASAWTTVSTDVYASTHSVELTSLAANTTYDVQVTATDAANNLSDPQTTTFRTLELNKAPVAENQWITLDEDSTVYLTLTATDENEGDVLEYWIPLEAGPSYGTLAGDPPNVAYEPDDNFSGTDTFTFQVTDGLLQSEEPGIVTLTVTPQPDPPSAPEITDILEGDASVTLTWSAATDPDGDIVTYAVFRDPEGDALTTGLPATSYSDSSVVNDTTYTYIIQASDGLRTTDSASVTATPRKIDANAYVIAEPTMVNGSLGGDTFETLTPVILGGLTGAQTLSELKVGVFGRLEAQYVLQTVVDPSSINTATLHLVGNLDAATDDTPWQVFVMRSGGWELLQDPADIMLQPGPITALVPLLPADVAADGTIQIAILDGSDIKKESYDTLALDTLYAEILAGPPNNPPTADAVDPVSVDEDAAVDITLSGTDPDGDTLSYTISQPSNGSATLDVNVVTYTPNPDYHGFDSFTFVVNDGLVDSETVTVPITVNPVNDPPVAWDQAVSTTPNTAIAITLVGSDVDGDTLSYTISQPSNGSATLNVNVVTYTPDASFSGTDSFTFGVNDGHVDSTPATVSITVSPNTPPTVSLTTDAASYTAPADITLTATANDVDGSVTQVEFFNGSDSIAVVTTEPFTFNWTGVAAGTYELTAVATDNLGATTRSAVVTVEVTEAPVISVVPIYLEPISAGKNLKGAVEVTVEDQDLNPVVGATVTGEWFYDGSSIGMVSGITDASGITVLTSSPVKTKDNLFTFVVLSVQPANP